MLDKRILNKLTMSGSKSDYMKKLLLDIDIHSIPAKLGGHYTGYNTPYVFNLRPDGPFHSASTMNTENIDTEATSSVASEGVIPIQTSLSNVSAANESILSDESAAWDEGYVNPLLLESAVLEGDVATSTKTTTDSAEKTLKKRSKSFKMKNILRLFSPSSTSSKSQPLSQESPSGRSDMDTTLPSDCSTITSKEAPPIIEDLSSPARLFLHNDSSSVDTSPSHIASRSHRSHKHHHHSSSSSRASSRSSRHQLLAEDESIASDRRRSSSRRSQAQSTGTTANNNHAGNTVTVGGLGRDRLSSNREAQVHHSTVVSEDARSVRSRPEKDRTRLRDRRLLTSKMSSSAPPPRPGESIEQWKTRVNYSGAAAASSSADLHRNCYSCFTAIDTGEAAGMGTFWFCF